MRPARTSTATIPADYEIDLIPGDLLFFYSDALTGTPRENKHPLNDTDLLEEKAEEVCMPAEQSEACVLLSEGKS